MSHHDFRFWRWSHFLALVVTLAFAALLLIPLSAAATGSGEAKEWGKPFQTIIHKINALEDRIKRLERQNARLKHELAKLKPVLDFAPYISLDEDNTIDGLAPPHMFLTGLNVHIRSGGGQTNVDDGRGNLIVGYNEDIDGIINDRTGSHNLVVGPEHTYSSFGGFVAGVQNSVTAPTATVSGGRANTADFPRSSVSGGFGNKADGDSSSVSGGRNNLARGSYSSVSGGEANTAVSTSSSVSGGEGNVASSVWSSVSGGQGNAAVAPYSSVSGGQGNDANDSYSSVSGGQGNDANGPYSSVSGGINCETIELGGVWGVGDTNLETTGCVKTNLP